MWSTVRALLTKSGPTNAGQGRTSVHQYEVTDHLSHTHIQQQANLRKAKTTAGAPIFTLSSSVSTATMNSVASKRLFQEYKHLTTDPPEGITAGPVNEDDLFLWEAMIQGPEGTPYEGGVFPAELKFPKDYPLMPPTMKFQCDIWHPNGKNYKQEWWIGGLVAKNRDI